ncbi:low temperature requirement protein A [Micromonospora sp. U56]|uniref:low temperature requirement protein A n=1 Tax=Micromonospora sp. U56 TaxID=2824900 RepID=UPI001B3806B6|nr:low temperature requirement protein A [Micromonospora sp. U56]MBQ0895340.1 low temperature requirement protein A [Micromonospora sp. U56]
MKKAGSAEDADGAGTLLRGEQSEQQASLVELFLDLVVVFALNRVVASGTYDLKSASLEVRWYGFLHGLLLILPLLWVWITAAYVTARFDPRRAPVQAMVLMTAFGLLLLGAAIPSAFNGGPLIFAAVYLALQAGRSLALYLMLRTHILSRVYLRTLVWSGVSAVPWLLGAFMPADFSRTLLWLIAIAIDFGAARLGWPVPGLGQQRITVWAQAPKHLADRHRQLMLIALGETILAVGVAYTDHDGLHSPTATLGLVLAFLTTVLLWRIYSHTAGELFGDAIESAKNPAKLGRVAQAAHVLMIVGVAATAVGHELIQLRATGRNYPSWLAVMVGGPALYVAGRALLERVVFSRVSPPRLLGIAALLVLAVPLAFAPPLAAVAVVPVVLLGIAVADVRRAAQNPGEVPAPAELS